MKKKLKKKIVVLVLLAFAVMVRTVGATGELNVNVDDVAAKDAQAYILNEPEVLTVDILLQRAEDYKAVNDFVGMIEAYNRAIELDSANAKVYMERGICYAELGENSLALSDFAACVKLEPTYVDAYIEMAVVLTAQGSYYDALQRLGAAASIDKKEIVQDVLQSDSQNARLYNSLGVIYFKEDDYEKALIAYKKAIDIDEKYSDAYNNRGVLYYKEKKYKLALDDFSRAIENNAQDAKAYNNRGLTRKFLKDYIGAIEDYEYAIKLDYKYTDALFNLACLCEMVGENKKAQLAYEGYLRYVDNNNLDRVSYVEKRLFSLQLKARKAQELLMGNSEKSI